MTRRVEVSIIYTLNASTPLDVFYYSSEYNFWICVNTIFLRFKFEEWVKIKKN